MSLRLPPSKVTYFHYPPGKEPVYAKNRDPFHAPKNVPSHISGLSNAPEYHPLAHNPVEFAGFNFGFYEGDCNGNGQEIGGRIAELDDMFSENGVSDSSASVQEYYESSEYFARNVLSSDNEGEEDKGIHNTGSVTPTQGFHEQQYDQYPYEYDEYAYEESDYPDLIDYYAEYGSESSASSSARTSRQLDRRFVATPNAFPKIESDLNIHRSLSSSSCPLPTLTPPPKNRMGRFSPHRRTKSHGASPGRHNIASKPISSPQKLTTVLEDTAASTILEDIVAAPIPEHRGASTAPDDTGMVPPAPSRLPPLPPSRANRNSTFEEILGPLSAVVVEELEVEQSEEEEQVAKKDTGGGWKKGWAGLKGMLKKKN